MSNSPYCYALISRGNTPLVQYCTEAGNFDLYYQKIISGSQIEENTPSILRQDNYKWGVLNDGILTFLCVAHLECSDHSMTITLNEMKKRFMKVHGFDCADARTYQFQSDFQPCLVEITNQQRLKTISPPSDFSFSVDLDDGIDSSLQPQSPLRNRNQGSCAWWALTTIICIAVILYIIFVFSCGGITLFNCLK